MASIVVVGVCTLLGGYIGGNAGFVLGLSSVDNQSNRNKSFADGIITLFFGGLFGGITGIYGSVIGGFLGAIGGACINKYFGF